MTCPPSNPAPGLTRGLRRHPQAPDQVRGGYPANAGGLRPGRHPEAPDQVRGGYPAGPAAPEAAPMKACP